MNKAIANKLACLLVACIYFTAISALPAWAQSSMVKVGEITVLEGLASVTHAGAGDSKALGLGDTVYQNDTISTGSSGKLRVTFLDGSIVSIATNSSLKVTEYLYDPQQQTRSSGLSLLWGKIKCLVNDLAGYKNKKFTVTTATAVAGVRGTDFMVWALNNQETQVAGFDKTVEVGNVSGMGTKVIITPNTITRVEEDMSPTTPKNISPAIMGVLMEGFLPMDSGVGAGMGAGTGAAPGGTGGAMAGLTYSQALIAVGGIMVIGGVIAAVASSNGDDDDTTTTTEHH